MALKSADQRLAIARSEHELNLWRFRDALNAITTAYAEVVASNGSMSAIKSGCVCMQRRSPAPA